MSSKKDKNPLPPGPGRSKQKLGRGLGALLGEMNREEPLVDQNPALAVAGKTADEPSISGTLASPVKPGQSGGGLRESLAMVPVAAIEPHPEQPRRQFDEQALAELSASIASRGVIQPIIVTQKPSGGYQIVAGERRWRAAQKAQLHEIPAIIRDLSEREVMAIALIENLQREDLNPVEEARAYRRLADGEGMSQAEIAELVDKSRSHVANLQRLLGLPEDVLAYVEAGQLSMGHARALIGHGDALALAERTVEQSLSVREVERLAKRSNGKPKARGLGGSPGGGNSENADIIAVQNHLEEILGLPVRINTDTDPRSGAMTIRYRTLDQLDLLCQRLTGGEI